MKENVQDEIRQKIPETFCYIAQRQTAPSVDQRAMMDRVDSPFETSNRTTWIILGLMSRISVAPNPELRRASVF
jgi:hypothetical protein